MFQFPAAAPDNSLQSGMVNAQTEGAKGDGATDDWAALRASYVKATLLGTGLYIPPGHYKVSRALQFGGGTGGQVRIIGFPRKSIIVSTAAGAAFTGHIDGTVLTVTAMASGELLPGSTITGGGTRCSIMTNGTGTGGAGTYNVDISQTAASGSMTAGNPILLIGNGVGVDGFLGGEVTGITAQGPSAAPGDGSSGIMLAGITDISVTRCEAENVCIGFDMVNNCFGANFSHCMTGSGGACRVGLMNRGGATEDDSRNTGGAGNQVLFSNCWFTGVEAGVMIGKFSDGITFLGGQVGCTGGGDAAGPFVLGKDWVSGIQGGVGVVAIWSVDMEQFKGWAIGRTIAQPIILLLDAFLPGRHTLATALALTIVPALLWLSGLRFQWRRDQRETRESIAGLMGKLVDQQRAELVRLVGEADALRGQIDLFTEGRWHLQRTLDDLREQVIAARVMIHDYERRLQLPETPFPSLPALAIPTKPV